MLNLFIYSVMSCNIIFLNESDALSRLEQSELMRTPLIIKGAMKELNKITLKEFKMKFGHHKVLAKRTNYYSHLDKDRFGTYEERMDQNDTSPKNSIHISIKDFIENAMSHDSLVLFDREPAMSILEQKLLDDLRYIQGPRILDRAKETQFLSLGGGVNGVNMANHGFTWIGLISGKKFWVVAPPETQRPEEVKCYRDVQRIPHIKDTMRCVQEEGDIIAVPTAWWHGTCNLHDDTIGIGKQDSCDLGCHSEDTDGFCINEKKYKTCWLRS